MKKNRSWFRKFWVVLLISQLAVPYPVVQGALTGNGNAGRARAGAPSAPISFPPTGLDKAFQNPLFDTLQEIGPLNLKSDFKENDVSIDTDPFFLRSQGWNQETENATLALPEIPKVWTVPRALQVHTVTDEYVFLTARDRSFFEKLAFEGLASEGLFFVSRAMFQQAGQAGKPVPVFFLPLPGDHWTGDVAIEAFWGIDTYVLVSSDRKTRLPFQEQDLKILQKAQELNLTLAQVWGVQSNGSYFPPVGSTAGFGLLFTGFDREKGTRQTGNPEGGWLSALVHTVFPVAHADEAADKAMAEFKGNLFQIASVLAVVLGVSVVLKYTLYRQFFAERNVERPKTWRAWIAGEFKDHAHVNVSSLNFIATIAPIWFGNTVEYIVDKYFPYLGAGEHSVLRKFLKSTVYTSRDAFEKLPVNAWTFLLGAGVLGGLDTLMMGVLYYGALPHVMGGIGSAIPALESRASEGVDLSNPNSELFMRIDIVRCFISYLTAGASQVSGDFKNYVYVQTEKQIEAEFKGQKLNLDDPHVQQMKKDRVEAVFQQKVKTMGLPGMKDFLGDPSTFWEWGNRVFGKEESSLRDSGNFPGVTRPGLVFSSLKKALKKAKKDLKQNPKDVELQGAVALLSDLQANVGGISDFVKLPGRWLWEKANGRAPPTGKEMVEKVRSTRQFLMLLTCDEAHFERFAHLPGFWFEALRKPGAQKAVQLYRETFRTYLVGLTAEQRAEEAAKPYEPVFKDSVRKKQEYFAVQKADEAFYARFGKAFEGVGVEEAEFWNKAYSEAILNRVGIYPDYSEDPDLEKQVEARARTLTEGHFNSEKAQAFLAVLSPRDQALYRASVLAENLAASYVETTTTSLSLSPLSPAQPGRFQKKRQEPGVRKSRLWTRFYRALESAFPLQEGHRLGRTAWLDRNIPGYYDLKLGNERAYRNAITSGTASYWFTYWVWGVALPPHLWILALILQFTVRTPTQILMRMFQMQGWQMFRSIKEMVLYTLLMSVATFWGSVPLLLFQNDFKALVDPVMGALGLGVAHGHHALETVCSFLLQGSSGQPP